MHINSWIILSIINSWFVQFWYKNKHQQSGWITHVKEDYSVRIWLQVCLELLAVPLVFPKSLKTTALDCVSWLHLTGLIPTDSVAGFLGPAPALTRGLTAPSLLVAFCTHKSQEEGSWKKKSPLFCIMLLIQHIVSMVTADLTQGVVKH